MKATKIKDTVRERYGRIAREDTHPQAAGEGCCGSGNLVETISRKIGYSDAELNSAPAGANLGLGCGNPVAQASLNSGETVVDLGCGAGFDCFLAAGKVGETGRVIGIDMTQEMLEKARNNAEKGNYSNVEFRQGEIDAIPLEDDCADVVISNCVINLAPDKNKVFAEAYRVLRPGGRIMVSDLVLRKQLPNIIRQSINALVGCVAGALLKEDYLAAIRTAGFSELKVVGEANYALDSFGDDPVIEGALNAVKHLPSRFIHDAIQSVVSINVQALKPR